MPIDTHLKEELDRIDREFGGDNMYKMLGPTLLSYTSTDSSRQYMFTSHIKQLLTLLEPDVPKLQTGFENVIGQYNKAFHELKGTWVVKDIIKKFDNSIMYLVVLYNVDTDTYDIIEKPVAENLTEKFGYEYNTDYMDSLKPGMVVHNEYLYKSTSYDPHMNYRYGKNARVFYSISTDTLEDAVTVRRSWANKITSVEVDDVMVSLNLNDILLNIYGDDDHYKAFPQIGECVKNSVLCATRRINKNHILYDFQAENLRRTYDTDVEYFVSKDAMIYDINVFYNGEEDFPDNLFHSQLKYYYEKNCEYAKNVLDWCDRIKASGSKYTDNVNFFREKFLNYNEYQWKNKDKAFGHIMVEFKVKANVPLETGSKLTGRYGNKGVIASFVEDVEPDEITPFSGIDVTVVDDERMPYYFDPDTGEKINVDIMLNMSSSVRRLNPAQLCEVELNFIAERVQNRVKTLKTLREKEELIFQFLSLVNDTECQFFHNMYNRYDYTETINGKKFRFLSPGAKEDFIHDVEEHGFYLIRAPHKPILYDEIKRIYDTFDWIKPVDLYINLFGIKNRKMMRRGVVGFEYMLVLKQTSRKNFSARSTYRINRANLPAKDTAKKTNKSSYARTPVRLSEIYALFPSISGRDLAEYNIFMRSSAIGRKSLERILEAEGNPMEIIKLKVHHKYTNANADILNARLKCIGLGIKLIRDIDEKPIPDIYETNEIGTMEIHGHSVVDYYRNYSIYLDLFEKYDRKMREFTMIESYVGEKSDTVWDQLCEDPEVKELVTKLGDSFEDGLDNLKGITSTEIKNYRDSLIKKRKKVVVEDDLSDNGVIEEKIPRRRGRPAKNQPEEE